MRKDFKNNSSGSVSQSTKNDSSNSTPKYRNSNQDHSDRNIDIIGVQEKISSIFGGEIILKKLFADSRENLVRIGNDLELEFCGSRSKNDLIFQILRFSAQHSFPIYVEGVLEILNEGFGFLRFSVSNYSSSSTDIYVSPIHIKKYDLRLGDLITGDLRSPRNNDKHLGLKNIIEVNGEKSNLYSYRPNFDSLTAVYPTERFNLDMINDNDHSTRVVDMMAPIGKGQRTLIVAPPRAGKTVLMQNIAHAIYESNPGCTLMFLLIGERPEEVTDIRSKFKGEVISSTFDESAIRNVQIAELVLERAKRLVEKKKDVVIMLDSITRLARAYNSVIPPSGRVLSGGIDAGALHRPKSFFGAARNIKEGGSLTIIGTALVDTGSRMDEVIFEEFKGTGNAEIVLDRRIAEKRIFPAIDIHKSGTRREELLLENATLSKVWILRRILADQTSTAAMELISERISKTKNNKDFFATMIASDT